MAIVYLTRRSDLIVREETSDIGIDLLVSVHSDGKEGLRLFGVELRSGWAAKTIESANAGLGPSMKKMLRYGPFPFPVALFDFTMQDNKGWYTWVVEPVIDSDGTTNLRQHREAHCHPLDKHAIDDIVEAVNRWYDHDNTTNSTAGKPRSSKQSKAVPK